MPNVRLDSVVIKECFDKFKIWRDTGEPVFTLDDYSILFQAGTFEFGKNAEDFCQAIFNHGPIQGERSK